MTPTTHNSNSPQAAGSDPRSLTENRAGAKDGSFGSGASLPHSVKGPGMSNVLPFSPAAPIPPDIDQLRELDAGLDDVRCLLREQAERLLDLSRLNPRTRAGVRSLSKMLAGISEIHFAPIVYDNLADIIDADSVIPFTHPTGDAA